MNPSGEVGKASGEETGIGETMEGVVTTVDAMTSAVDAVEAMVMAVEMREWLEVGRPETERTTAIHFFSRAMVVQERTNLNIEYEFDSRWYEVPLYWPGLLPGLVPLLTDCLLPHNSKAIQSGALLSLGYLISYYPWAEDRKELVDEMVMACAVPDHLFRLVRESSCLEIRDQASSLLGRVLAFWRWGREAQELPPTIVSLGLDFLPLINDLIHKYAAIEKPTETELSSLSNAIIALRGLCAILGPIQSSHPFLLNLLPVLARIFTEPDNRKEAQIPAGKFLYEMAWLLDGNSFIESGVVGMLLETLRVGKESTPVLAMALQALRTFLSMQQINGLVVVIQKALDMGLLDVIHQVLKRPNVRIRFRTTLWSEALNCLNLDTEVKREAILNEKGMLELILELSRGMELTEEASRYHGGVNGLLYTLTDGSANQIRQLMSKESFFPVLGRLISPANDPSPYYYLIGIGQAMATVEKCLASPASVAEFGLRRRLADSSGLTDSLRRISLSPDYPFPHDKERACNILDTYLTHPLPPRPTHNLPSIIYTRNVQF